MSRLPFPFYVLCITCFAPFSKVYNNCSDCSNTRKKPIPLTEFNLLKKGI